MVPEMEEAGFKQPPLQRCPARWVIEVHDREVGDIHLVENSIGPELREARLPGGVHLEMPAIAPFFGVASHVESPKRAGGYDGK